MELEQPFLIKKLEGYPEEISQLVCMLNYARYTTLKAVEGLTQGELDQQIVPDGNSIAMLLEHFIAVETLYQIYTFENRDLTEDERAPL